MEKAQFFTQIVREAKRRLIVLLREDIPFVHNDDNALAGFVDIARDLRILLQNSLGGVDDHENDTRTVNGTQGAHHTVPLHGQTDLPLAAHPCSINKKILRPIPCKVCVDRVAGRPGHIADNDALLAEQTIHK